MQVAEIMSAPVVSVGIDADLQTAVEAMLEHRVGCVIVMDESYRGIVTRSDALRATCHTGEPLRDLVAREVMSADLVTIGRDSAVETALRLMAEHNVKKLPVVDIPELEGIVTMTDIAEHLPERVQETRQVLDRRDDWTG